MFGCKESSVSSWHTVKRGPYQIIIPQGHCQKTQGMQHLTSFPPNTVMLFKHLPKGMYFHTRNCKFPLDIVPLSNLGEVIKIWTVFPGVSNIGPLPYLTSKVLEAPAGFFKERNIRAGDYLPLFNL
jgi:uncharacterized membrane protein (UPF0127 family)